MSDLSDMHKRIADLECQVGEVIEQRDAARADVERLRSALDEALVWLKALVSDAQPGSEESTHLVVTTITKGLTALASLREKS